MNPQQTTSDAVIARTQSWLIKAVIGLNLCPFAKLVHEQQRIRYTVSAAKDAETLLEDLVNELRSLAAADPKLVDTSLLIHPDVFLDFLDFNDFLVLADSALNELQLEGVLQIASFHPNYQFAGTNPDDVENYTNRSPFPTLHLLREASIDKAVDSFPETDKIFEKNIETLRTLGTEGWKKLNI